MQAPANPRRSRSTLIRAENGTASSAASGPAAQSEFSLLPAQNTSGDWVKVVQRIPLRVANFDIL